MTKNRLFMFAFVMLWGFATIFSGGCKPQEPSRISIVVEGRELSDAEIIIDEKPAGRLTQTIITADGKLYIDGMFVARAQNQNGSRQGDSYTGCVSSLSLTPGKHTITLQKKDIQPLTVITDTTPGYHLLTYFPEKDRIKWDNTAIQVGPERKVTVDSEKTK